MSYYGPPCKIHVLSLSYWIKHSGHLVPDFSLQAAEMSEDQWGHLQSCEEATGIPSSVLETVLDILRLLRNWDCPQYSACKYGRYRDAMGDLIGKCREDKCDVTDPDAQCILLQCVQQVWERVNALVREGHIVPWSSSWSLIAITVMPSRSLSPFCLSWASQIFQSIKWQGFLFPNNQRLGSLYPLALLDNDDDYFHYHFSNTTLVLEGKLGVATSSSLDQFFLHLCVVPLPPIDV